MLRENNRLRVLENGMVRRIFESKRDEVKGCWTMLQNEELHNLYLSPDIIRMIQMKGDEVGGMLVIVLECELVETCPHRRVL
jgi:acyl-coenzyme A synthetase/AMP-(fatty) acid ligase